MGSAAFSQHLAANLPVIAEVMEAVSGKRP